VTLDALRAAFALSTKVSRADSAARDRNPQDQESEPLRSARPENIGHAGIAGAHSPRFW